MQYTSLGSSTPSAKHGGQNNEQLSMGVEQWLNESSCGSRPSSIAVEPYTLNPFLSPMALSTDTKSLSDDVADSSPIAADRLYRPSEQGAVAALCLHSSPDDSIDGPLEIRLYAGLSSISGLVSCERNRTGDQAVCLPIAQAINAAIEIDDGLHVLYDYGSAEGVFLGHRRARVKCSAGYVIFDGKLVWFGGVSFWYRVLDDPRRSKSPTPPWRDMHTTDITLGMHKPLHLHSKALVDTMRESPAPLGLPPPSSPLGSTSAGTRDGLLAMAQPAVLKSEDYENRPRATRLRREVAAPAISLSPALQLSALGSPPGGPLSLLVHGSPGGTAMSYHGSPQEVIDEFGFSTGLINSPRYGSDSEESIAKDTEILSDDDESQFHAHSSPRAQLPSVHSSLRIAELRVDGDILAPGSDDEQQSRAPTEVLSTGPPSPQPVEAPPTQPISPSRLPPQGLLASASRGSSAGDALLERKQLPEYMGGTQAINLPAADPPLAYFPQPSALVCAPSRVILVGPHTTGSPYLQQAAFPRYPYDVEGMESFLRSATQNTLPTQPEVENADGLESNQLSVDTMQGSDFSQNFISPPPPSVAAIPSALRSLGMGSSRMSVDSTDTQSSKEMSPALATQSVSSVQEPAVTPANPRRLATSSKRHRRSIDNYTDEDEDDDDEVDDGEAMVVVCETPAKRNISSGHPPSRSGSRLSMSSTSTRSLSSSAFAVASSVRSLQRFNTPASMSSRIRHARRTPLNLKSSTQLPSLRMETPSRTPLTRGSNGRSSASSNYPSLPPTAFLVSGSVRSAGIEVSRPFASRIPNDGFPDMDPGPLLETLGVNRASRGYRRYTQGSGTPLTAVNPSHSPLMYPHGMGSVAQTYRPMTGVLESPMSIDSPTTAYTRPPAPTETLVVKRDEPLLSSSPDLPHPRTLVESIVGATAKSLEKMPASASDKEKPRGDSGSVDVEALFDPLKDPLSSVPTSSKTSSEAPEGPEPFAEPVDDDTQLDHEDSIVPVKSPPRIHLRVPTKSSTSFGSSAADSTNDVLAEVEAGAPQQPATNVWINSDGVPPADAQAKDQLAKPTRSTNALRRGRGVGRVRGRGGKISDVPASSPRTPSSIPSTVSPAGSRSNTLLDSLRKLPGKPGSKRTGLSASRRTPVAKKLASPVGVKGAQSASESPTPKAMSVATRALTATAVTTKPPPLSPSGDSSLLRQDSVDVKPRVYGAKSRAGGRVSHRNLGLAQATPTKVQLPTLPPKPKTADKGAALVSVARLTRQNSSDASGIRMVALTGFLGDDLDQVVRKLESHGLSVTDNPLIADVCVRQGKLGRTLKVLCALARGIPVVSPNWISDLGSVALRTRSTSALKALASLALAHLLIDRVTEREWGFTLADTLCKAREMNGGGLLAGFCVYVTPNVTRPDPASLSVMVRSAGAFVLNDFGRGEERILRGEDNVQLDSHLNRRSASATAPDLIVDDCGTPVTTADCVLAGELTDSTEPDDDEDEDWSASNTRARRSSGGGITSSGGGKPRRKRKTLPKLASIEYESSDDGGGTLNTNRFKLKSEPSMIFAPPHGSTTPVRNREASESPSVRQRPPSSANKRRRISESPNISATTTHFGCASDAGLGSVTMSFDPQCSRQDMVTMLAARKSELGVPEDAQLLVVSANTELALQKTWETHGAVVVDPELIIQSIIHCSRQF
ncbi:Mediator of DNA damage checkpoint protein 1 [Coemansia sp. RSA 2050]|nr:Mediator of DNA damage checkpoint protein 1 [Coemansia sp. RSA 2050]